MSMFNDFEKIQRKWLPIKWFIRRNKTPVQLLFTPVEERLHKKFGFSTVSTFHSSLCCVKYEIVSASKYKRLYSIHLMCSIYILFIRNGSKNWKWKTFALIRRKHKSQYIRHAFLPSLPFILHWTKKRIKLKRRINEVRNRIKKSFYTTTVWCLLLL